jgi:hypothetical protein
MLCPALGPRSAGINLAGEKPFVVDNSREEARQARFAKEKRLTEALNRKR